MTKIYYFSGTGNCLWSAKKIAQLCGENSKLYNIADEIKKSIIDIKADKVIIVFPAYAYGLPIIVRRFVKRAVFETPYLAAFVTFGSSPGGALGEMRRILKKKNIDKLYFGRIPTVENFLVIFGHPKKEIKERRLAMQAEATEEAARIIMELQENKVFTFRIFSSFVSFLFSLAIKIFYKYFRVSQACNGCGICEKTCPVKAIVLTEGHPVFRAGCQLCVACIDLCPQNAIKYGRKKFGTPGYRHPEISINELGPRESIKSKQLIDEQAM